MAPKAISGTPQGFDPNNPNKAIPGYGVNSSGQFFQFGDSKWNNFLNNTQFGQHLANGFENVNNGQYKNTPMLPNSPSLPNAAPGIGAISSVDSQIFQSPNPQIPNSMPVANTSTAPTAYLQRSTPLASNNIRLMNQFQNPFLRF